MPQKVIDLDPVEYITIDLVDVPGDRLFLLQGQSGRQVITLVIEQDQAAALALACGELLDILDESYPREINQYQVPHPDSLSLQIPFEPLFPVAQFQLGYDDERDRTAIVTAEVADDDELETGEAHIVRFWITREQLLGLMRQIEYLIDTYLPACPVCGQPLEADGHWCIRGN